MKGLGKCKGEAVRMLFEGYWITSSRVSDIERENPETGRTETCEGYLCRMYEDKNCGWELDSFSLAVRYDIPDLSEESLEKGILEYMIPYWGLGEEIDRIREDGEEILMNEIRSGQGTGGLEFGMRPASADEAEAFFAQMPEQDRQMGAIGHVRIDFGMDGDEFWHTWHPRGEESLNSVAFRTELGQVVDWLRGSVLKDLRSMGRFCHEQGGEIPGGWRQNYGYVVETEGYGYYLRCSPGKGDYHAYLTCFDLNVQRENLAKENAFSDRRGDSGIKSVVGSFRIMWDGFRKEMPGNPKKSRQAGMIRAYRNGGYLNEVSDCGKALRRHVAGGGPGCE